MSRPDPQTPTSTPPLTLAAVDLGSNSFHMVVMRQSDAGLQVMDRIREPVRLASGLQADKTLSAEAQQRAIECLGRFGQILRGIPASQTRVVGTNTLRRLKQSSAFLLEAEKALGRPVEIISGVEEARLIYSGVSHGLTGVDEKRLVVDIGGGSTELIVGKGARPRLMESVHMGCVSHTQRFFADGQINAERLSRARRAAAAEVDFLEKRYREKGWQRAVGSSGSVRSVWRVAAELGFGDDHISREGLEGVYKALKGCARIKDIKFDGLRDDRRAVFVGSVTVLAGVFDTLGIERMDVSDRALREGAIYDLIGRISDGDVREKSVRFIGSRFTVDEQQARRVEQVAQRLFTCVAKDWGLDVGTDWPYLHWASALHELGLAISHSGFHKHGAYVLAKADMHGFSRRDQLILAALVRVHRGRLAREIFAELPSPWQQKGLHLALLLRIAVLLCRSRQDVPALGSIELETRAQRLTLRLPADWLALHPLTEADVETEAGRLSGLGWKLKLAS